MIPEEEWRPNNENESEDSDSEIGEDENEEPNPVSQNNFVLKPSRLNV